MDIKYDNDGDRIQIISQGDDTVYLFLRLHEDGELLNITVQLDDPEGNFLAVPFDHQYIKEFMGYLLHQSYKYKLGFWSYDPTDGDVRFKLTHAIESNDLSEDQFKRLIMISMNVADKGSVAIRKILATGETAADEDDGLPDLDDVESTEDLANEIRKKISAQAAELIKEGKIEEAKELLAMFAQLDGSSEAESKPAIDGI